jgi:hypothetical protein
MYIFFVSFLKQDLEPDPLVRGSDLRIWVRTYCTFHGSGTLVQIILFNSLDS